LQAAVDWLNLPKEPHPTAKVLPKCFHNDPLYSARSATIESVLAARHAGMTLAMSATSFSRHATPAKVRGSVAFTP